MAVVGLTNGAFSASFAAADLNTLANNSAFTSTLTAPQIDNTGGSFLFAQFEVSLAAFTPTVGANCIVALIPETRTAGTYVTGSDGATVNDQHRWQNYPHSIIALRVTGSAAQVQRGGLVSIAPEKYRVYFINRSGGPLAASGNMVFHRTIQETVT